MSKAAIGPTHYRANEVTDQNGTRVTIEAFAVMKVTPSGFWIASEWDATYPFSDLKRTNRLRWVSSTSDRRFAYPDYKDALYSLYRRKQRQVRIIRLRLQAAELVIAGYAAFKSLPVDDFLHPRGVAVGTPDCLTEWVFE
jgi:hypothetical protein